MVSVETRTERRNDVTLVGAVVTNSRTTPQRIRLESRFDGPTWSPGRVDAPEPEWIDGGWESVVRPGRRRGVGFATPEEPIPTPLEVASVTRADRPDRSTHEEVLATLEESKPPRRVVSPHSDG
ncbi:DUF7857 domain-containing protein [Natrarchaeobius oligotrophus]|uniref:Uncharacterized protein n=1 Tax=Natrarchaeobius chitinivorans TaxID=1679083 RepID=A0A3N6MJ95_NATCH|nr:hypothetical protein [Natrarchaeobius chitinivorans]RQH03438.1 hypothetical protein EA472_02460 [Natrarchaeobius chitinivorans]